MTRVITAFRRARYHLLDEDDPARKRVFLEEVTRDDKQLKQLEDTDLFRTVGEALSIWGGLEECLVILFSYLLRSDWPTAGTILYSVVNFNVWLSIIDDLIAQDEHLKSLKPRWNKIAERLRGLKEMRDRLAHNTAFIPGTIKTRSELKSLQPSAFDARRRALKHHPLTTGQIRIFIESVTDAIRNLGDFHDDVLAIFVELEEELSLEKSSQQDSDRSDADTA